MSCLTKQKQEVLTSIETVCTLAMRSERQKNYSAHKYTDIVCHLYVLDEGKKKKNKRKSFILEQKLEILLSIKLYLYKSFILKHPHADI